MKTIGMRSGGRLHQCRTWWAKSQFGFLLVLFSLTVCHGAPGQTPSVRLTAIDGESVDGNLQSADTQRVRLNVSGEPKEWESQNVLKVELARKSTTGTAPLELGLLDGSRLKGTKLVGTEQLWQFGDSSGTVQEFGPGVVRSLLVRNLTPELSAAWNEALKEPDESDALILLRPGNVVDRVNGIITEVKDGRVVFDLDGQSVDVNFEKLLGMVWFRKQQDRMKPKIQIEFADGSLVLTEALATTGDSLTYRSISNKDVSIPIARVASLNYASANVKWLAELPVLNAASDGRIDWKGDGNLVGKVLAPQFITSRGQGAAIESAKPEDLDLVFLSPGSFTFRAPDGFSKFRALVERLGIGNARSEVVIEVWEDDQKLMRHALAANEDTLELDVPVSGGKKITFKVASSNRLQIGSQVTWKQPRLTR
jgi:hypothetical protein